MKILVTGGAGYIGSHTVLSLLEAGHQPVVVDDFSNSKPESLRRVAELARALPGSRLTGEIPCVRMDLCDEAALASLWEQERFDAVIHFAGLKAVGESVREPLRYFSVNIGSTLVLLRVMERFGCRNLVFSSSATVYGVPEKLPLTEECRLSAESPYGRTKLMIEDMLRDLAAAPLKAGASPWRIALLRYFNPVGAHASGRIGEDPNGIPNNLFPFVTQVAVGRLACLSVYGADYPTKDGTGVRDYLHVVDLAEGHVRAVEALQTITGAEAFNLGTGRGNSVLEVISAFEAASGVKVAHKLVARRPGDVAACYADASKAERVLGWKARLGLDAMCRDSWRWQQGNPQGYA